VYHFILSALLATLFQSLIAQSSFPLIGSRAAGVGYATSCLTDGWAIFNNPAGLAALKNLEVGFAYESVPGFSPFNRMATFIAAPVRIGVFNAGVFRFGDDLYNEQKINFGYANKFGLASLGTTFQYIQYHVEGFGQKSLISFSFGGIAELTPWLKLGAYIINLSQPEISEDEKLPTSLIAGICVKASQKVLALIEIEKDLDYEAKLKLGIEYEIHKKFAVRTGVNVNPQTAFFGFGFMPGKLKLDYTYSFLTITSRHQVSVGYTFKNKQ
jgi:hypothetical protein